MTSETPEPQPSAEQQPSTEPQKNNRAAILEALLAACAERGHATFQDTSHLSSIPRRTRQRVITQLHASGRLRRRGLKLYATDLKVDPKIQDLDLLDLPPPPVRSKWTIRATDKELADIKERNPEGASAEVLALLGKKKSLRMTTLELDNLLHERGLLTKPPIPADDEPVPPTPTHVDEETPEYFEHSPQTFLELLKCIPSGVERWAPGTEQWVKENYDKGIDAGNPPENMFLGLLNVELPRYLRERGFQTLCRCFPGVSWTRARFDAHIDAALKADEQLKALRDGHRDKGKIVVDVTANTIEEILRGVAIERRPSPSPAPSSTPAATTTSPRETANPEQWYAEQERDLRGLKSAIDNDYRTHVHMDSGVDRFVKATAAIGRAQPLPKKSNQSD